MKTLFSATVILMVTLFNNSFAQEGNYWSENYGNRSMLLSGTVNASVEDLGAVFYNPGRLGLIENPAFAISAKVYEWRTLKIEDYDQGIKKNKSNFGGAPSLAAGTFKLPFLKDHKFAYSFLTRQRSKIDFFTRIEREGDLINGLPGESDIFNNKLDIKSDFREEWIGLTWAPPTTKNYNIGLSTFISTLNKSNSLGVDMNAINEFNQVAHYSVNRSYGYNSYGILWKLGFALKLNKLLMGLTITTPRINVVNSGSFLFEDYLVGVDTTGDGNNDDGYIFDSQDNLKVKYKSPWAIGLGVGIPLRKGTVHLSTEWYSKIRDYTILSINPFVGQSTGDTVHFELKENLQSVLNMGIGLEWHFNDKISTYASFATDFSAVLDELNRFSEFDQEASNSIFKADFYQFGGGVAVNTRLVEITFGATYKGGSDTFENKIDFPDTGDPTEDPAITKISFRQLRFILGFSFPFGDQVVGI